MQFEIEACPFCAEDSWELQIDYTNGGDTTTPERYFVRCSACGAEGPLDSTPEEALSLWNAAERKKEKE